MKAEPLKRISVVLEAGALPGRWELRVPEAKLSFVLGICSNATIQACHPFSLEPEIGAGRSRRAQSKMTDGNPAHEDMMECAALAGPDFMVNVVPNLDGDICGIFTGNWASAWRSATRLVDEIYGAAIEEKADIVTTLLGMAGAFVGGYLGTALGFGSVTGSTCAAC